MKRILALLLAVIMTLALAVTAFAEEESGTPTTPKKRPGTITITNAKPETRYTVYRAFDSAFTTNDNGETLSTYTIDVTEGDEDALDADGNNTTVAVNASKTNKAALIAAINNEINNNGFKNNNRSEGVVTDNPVCSFLAKETTTTGLYNITQKKDFPENAGRGWLKGKIDLLTKVRVEDAKTETVVIDDLSYGYYLIVPSTKGADDKYTDCAVVSVTTTAPSATVIDKNTRTASGLDKTTPDYSKEIGGVVPYTVSFLTTNFRVADATAGMYDSKRVMSYTIQDTDKVALDFLSTNNGDSKTPNTNNKYPIFGDENAKITLYKTKNANGTFSDPILFADGTTGGVAKDIKVPTLGDDKETYYYPPLEWTSKYVEATTTTTTGSGKSTTVPAHFEINIVWGDYTGIEKDKSITYENDIGENVTGLKDVATGNTSRYPDGVYVVIEYSMKVTDEVYVGETSSSLTQTQYKVQDTDNYVKGIMNLENTYKGTNYLDPNPKTDKPETFGEDDVKTHSAGISIRKIDSSITDTNNQAISGAKFVLYKVVEEEKPVKDGEPGETEKVNVNYYWSWVETEETKDKPEAEKKYTIKWVTDIKEATVKTADNDTHTAEFYALEVGTYYMRETEAPTGYALPTSDFKLVISKVTPAAEGQTAKPADQYFDITVDGNAIGYNKNTGIYTSVITNSKGNNLPSTGGIGTTIFYVVGGVLAAGAFVLFVTKRRMNENA